MTRHEASELIDRYILEHPNSEVAYQKWKTTLGLPASTAHPNSLSNKVLHKHRVRRRLVITCAVAGVGAVCIAVALILLFPDDKHHDSTASVIIQPSERASKQPPKSSNSTAQSAIVPFPVDTPSPIDPWSPPKREFVRLTAAVSLFNKRGKEVMRLPSGKRLKVVKRLGDQVMIDYVGRNTPFLCQLPSHLNDVVTKPNILGSAKGVSNH